MNKKVIILIIIIAVITILILFVQKNNINKSLKDNYLDNKKIDFIPDKNIPPTSIKQGFFGTVYYHEFGCGIVQVDQDGKEIPCGAGESYKRVREGLNVSVYIVDKFDEYGDVFSTHSVANTYTDSNGSYSIYIEKGDYVLCVNEGPLYKECANKRQPITINNNELVEINLIIQLGSQ